VIELLVAAGLLGRHVQRGAEHHAGLGQPRRVALAGRAHVLRDAEVHDLDEVLVLAAQQEHVLRLHVAVDDALGVRGAQRRRDLLRDQQDALLGQRALAQQALGERLALEELHHHERPAVAGGAEVGDVDDVLVADRGGEPRLLLEPRDDLILARVLVEQDLDRDALADQRVGGLVDRAHAALADLARDVVAAEQGLADQLVLLALVDGGDVDVGVSLGVARGGDRHCHGGVGGGRFASANHYLGGGLRGRTLIVTVAGGSHGACDPST
jgi:hypothetical protein